jgi:hypothetical protein
VNLFDIAINIYVGLYKGSLHLTQNFHRFSGLVLFLHNHFMGWDSSIHLGGEYLEKTALYETGSQFINML